MIEKSEKSGLFESLLERKGEKGSKKKWEGKMRIKGTIGFWQILKIFSKVLASLLESLLERKGQKEGEKKGQK